MNADLNSGSRHVDQGNMEDLLTDCSNFNLTNEDESSVTVCPEIVDKGKRLVTVGLVGKLFATKMVTKKAFIDTITQLWKIDGLNIDFLANNHFLFTFPKAEDIDRILSIEPWKFSRSFLFLKRFEWFFMGVLVRFLLYSFVRELQIYPFLE